jgi:hypothetical protein
VGLFCECLHVIEVGNLVLLIGNNWESEVATSNLIDILDPSSVAVDGVGGEAN